MHELGLIAAALTAVELASLAKWGKKSTVAFKIVSYFKWLFQID